MESIGVVILAAGSSSRMGQPKQLINFAGEQLIERAARTAIFANLGPVVVVVGCNEEPVRKALYELPLQVVDNRLWRTGKASSIRKGIEAVENCPAAIIMVADQPFIEVIDLEHLAETYRTLKHEQLIADAEGPIAVALCTGNRIGNPALFSRDYYAGLKSLTGEQGGITLLPNDTPIVQAVNESAFLDIDTPHDLDCAEAILGGEDRNESPHAHS